MGPPDFRGGAVEIFANKQWNNGFINFWGLESP